MPASPSRSVADWVGQPAAPACTTSIATVSLGVRSTSSPSHTHPLPPACFKKNNQVRDVSRIEGLLSDAEMIGQLSWAIDPQTQLWWPVEVLDPLSMPKGAELVPSCREEGMCCRCCLPWYLELGSIPWRADTCPRPDRDARDSVPRCWGVVPCPRGPLPEPRHSSRKRPGRSLPPGALSELSPEQKVASLPAYAMSATLINGHVVRRADRAREGVPGAARLLRLAA